MHFENQIQKIVFLPVEPAVREIKVTWYYMDGGYLDEESHDVTLHITQAGQNDCRHPQQKLSLHLQWSRVQVHSRDRRDDTQTAFFCINSMSLQPAA